MLLKPGPILDGAALCQFTDYKTFWRPLIFLDKIKLILDTPSLKKKLGWHYRISLHNVADWCFAVNFTPFSMKYDTREIVRKCGMHSYSYFSMNAYFQPSFEVLTLIGMRQGTFHPLSFFDQTLSAECLPKISKLFGVESSHQSG